MTLPNITPYSMIYDKDSPHKGPVMLKVFACLDIITDGFPTQMVNCAQSIYFHVSTPLLVDSPHKGPVMFKAFPYHHTITGGFPSQKANNAQGISISWHHTGGSPHKRPITLKAFPYHDTFTGGSPHKRPIMLKAFLYHDTILVVPLTKANNAQGISISWHHYWWIPHTKGQ